MDLFYAGQNKTLLPGAWPLRISMKTQDVVTGHTFTLGGGQGCLFEYLPKTNQLLGGTEKKYEAMTGAFLEAAEKHLLHVPTHGRKGVSGKGVDNVYRHQQRGADGARKRHGKGRHATSVPCTIGGSHGGEFGP